MKLNRIGNILLSFLIAFGLWLYVVTVVSPDQERIYYNVPVTFQNASTLTDRGLMMISGGDATVSITMKGSRVDLNKINSSNLSVVVDLSTVHEAGEYLLAYNVYTPSDVSSGAVTTQSKDPIRISVEVANRISKEVAVVVNYVGEIPEGYMLDKSGAELDYPSVIITGPEDVVEQISQAAITVNCDGSTESISGSYRFELRDAEGNPVDAGLITANVAEVHLNVRIARTKNVPLKLTVVEGGGATLDTTKLLFSTDSITVSGSESVLENLEEVVLGTVNLANIVEDTTMEFEVVLPEGVENESRITTVTVDISFPQLATATFDVKSINMINVADGMQAELLTQVLTVTVRGPEDQIQKLKDSYIKATADLDGVTGTVTVEPTFDFLNSFPDVGAIGKYSVSVRVSEIPEETTAPEGE